MTKLNGKVAVITGGNSGIGLSTAQRFVEEGAKVIIFGRNQETLDRAVETLGNGTIGVRGDVGRIADLEKLIDTAQKAHGGIDVLFVNAGIAEFAALDDADEAHYDRLFNVNVKGAYFTVQKAIPALNQGASVILTTSATNTVGLPSTSVYAATKAALRSLARTLSTELIGRGIRVNALSPGLTETPLLDKIDAEPHEIEAFGGVVVGRTPLARLGLPSEIAGAATFLASDDSTYIVGAELVADGGFSQI